MTDEYRVGLALGIRSQWRCYRSWVRKAEKANTFEFARYCLDLAEESRERAVRLESEARMSV